MKREITSDQDATVLKKLSSPRRHTVVDKNLRVSDDDDVSRLNDAPASSEKKGLPPKQDVAEKPRKATVVGNHGPDKDGKIDWSKNPDSVDAILQYHEQYGHLSDSEGYLQTGQKCFRQFNKLFSARVTPEEIAEGLSQFNEPSAREEFAQAREAAPAAEEQPQEATEQVPVKKAPPAPSKVETFFKLRTKTVPVVTEKKVVLRGVQFEICKILDCKNICLMQPDKGRADQNGYFHAACANSDGEKIFAETCPQQKELPEKEQLALELFKAQFNGDELQAKKFLFLTRKIYGNK
jgi:hypothetical protein